MMYFIEDESLVVVCCVVLHYAMNWIQKMWHMKPQGSPCGYLGLIQQYSIDYVHMHVRLVYWTSPPPTIYTLHPHYTWGEGKVEPITMYMYICWILLAFVRVQKMSEYERGSNSTALCGLGKLPTVTWWHLHSTHHVQHPVCWLPPLGQNISSHHRSYRMGHSSPRLTAE